MTINQAFLTISVALGLTPSTLAQAFIAVARDATPSLVSDPDAFADLVAGEIAAQLGGASGLSDAQMNALDAAREIARRVAAVGMDNLPGNITIIADAAEALHHQASCKHETPGAAS